MRPKESLSANTRLFFGVEPETEEEKSKTAFKLKVAYIISFQQKNATLIKKKINLKAAHIAPFQQKITILICTKINLKPVHIISFKHKATTLI